MIPRDIGRLATRLALAACLALPMAGTAALAKNDGGGHGGGNAGGNGGGHGGGHNGAGGGGSGGGAAAAAAGGGAFGGGGGRGAGSAAAEIHAGPSARGGLGHDALGHARGGSASALGALNAAHASDRARDRAAPGSRVGMIASYENAMLRALSMPSATPSQRAARSAAIAQARGQLATASNKPVTGSVARQVDRMLGLPTTGPAPYGG